MFAGDIIIKNGQVYLRTIDDEELLFLWKNKELSPDDLWVRMLMTERFPVCFIGTRINDVLSVIRRSVY